MDSTGIIALLYLAGITLLVAEVFVPSHGLLTVGAVACLGVAVYHTFQHTTTGGAIGMVLSLILVPTVLLLGLKNVQRLPMGDKIAPPNPGLQTTQYDVGQHQCAGLVGREGHALTPLRPVGFCMFDGIRVPCVAESGIIDAHQPVIGVGVNLNNLVVRASDPGGRRA